MQVPRDYLTPPPPPRSLGFVHGAKRDTIIAHALFLPVDSIFNLPTFSPPAQPGCPDRRAVHASFLAHSRGFG